MSAEAERGGTTEGQCALTRLQIDLEEKNALDLIKPFQLC